MVTARPSEVVVEMQETPVRRPSVPGASRNAATSTAIERAKAENERRRQQRLTAARARPEMGMSRNRK